MARTKRKFYHFFFHCRRVRWILRKLFSTPASESYRNIDIMNSTKSLSQPATYSSWKLFKSTSQQSKSALEHQSRRSHQKFNGQSIQSSNQQQSKRFSNFSQPSWPIAEAVINSEQTTQRQHNSHRCDSSKLSSKRNAVPFIKQFPKSIRMEKFRNSWENNLQPAQFNCLPVGAERNKLQQNSANISDKTKAFHDCPGFTPIASLNIYRISANSSRSFGIRIDDDSTSTGPSHKKFRGDY